MTDVTNCLKCSYKPGEPKGERVCRKCGRPENVSKAEWPPAAVDLGGISIADLIGSAPAPCVSPAEAAMAVERAYREQPTQAAPAAGLGVPHGPPCHAPSDIAGAGSDTQTPAPSTAAGVSPVPAAAISSGSCLRGCGHVADRGGLRRCDASCITGAAPEDALAPTVAGGDTLQAGDASPACSGSSTNVGTAERLPEHSPKGGSGAKRWMNCTASVSLIERLVHQGVELDDETAWARRGTLCHEIAERALTHEMDVATLALGYPEFNVEDAPGVQQYVDYVRSLPGRKSFEVFYHHPHLHKYFYGKIDAEAYSVMMPRDGIFLEIVDFKAGEGVYVDEVDNYQGRYYLGLVIMSDPEFFPDEAAVRFTVGQPFLTWVDNPIRSWDTTAGEIKRWVHEDLLPAMRDESAGEFKMGEWCQFCPRAAKLACPAQQAVQDEQATQAALGDERYFEQLSDEELGRRYVLWELNKTYGKALAVEAHKRLMDRKIVPGVKLVAAKADRAWKENVEEKAKAQFGERAYTEPKLLSPAQLEKLPDGGKDFVAEWAYRPDTGYSVALEHDRRKSVAPKSGSELWANTYKHLDNP